MEQLINNLIQQGYLKTPRIINAFRKIKRADFVAKELKNKVNVNAPLPIGYGQTISQPLTVAFMLELLEPREGDKILDVGSGSGWQTAMLAEIVGEKGKVYGVERIPELKAFGENNIKKYQFKNIEFILGDGSVGLKKESPFDKIIVAAVASGGIPKEFKNQLKIKGRLVIPAEGSIWLIVKEDENKFTEQEFPGFAFVPLVRNP